MRRAWLRVTLLLRPGLELLLGLSLLRWASGWEQGHVIRLSAELFIPGRRATAGEGVGPDAGPFTRVLLKAAELAVLLELRWGRNPPELLSALGCVSGADEATDDRGLSGIDRAACLLSNLSGCSSPSLAQGWSGTEGPYEPCGLLRVRREASG